MSRFPRNRLQESSAAPPAGFVFTSHTTLLHSLVFPLQSPWKMSQLPVSETEHTWLRQVIITGQSCTWQPLNSFGQGSAFGPQVAEPQVAPGQTPILAYIAGWETPDRDGCKPEAVIRERTR